MVRYPHPSGEGKVKWVSTDWLEEHLEDKGLMIVDAQPNIHDYIQEHIRGAVYMNEGLLREPLKGKPGYYIPPEAVGPIFSRLGLRPDLPVVVYTGTGPFKGWGDGLEQTMVAYSLVRFGHDNVYILDGGIDKWKEENRPLTKVFPEKKESIFPVTVRSDYYIEYERFKAEKDREDVMVLDNRPAHVYEGIVEGSQLWIRTGHIPGAISLPWPTLMTDENRRLLKPEDEIKSILRKRGVTPDKTIIATCGTGREATNQFILYKWYLGYPRVKIYEGGFTEWVSFPENPTVTGKSPK